MLIDTDNITHNLKGNVLVKSGSDFACDTSSDSYRSLVNAYSTTTLEAACSLCEEEGKPNRQAHNGCHVTSTQSDNERLLTVCIGHGDDLKQGRLPYRVLAWREGVNRNPFWSSTCKN